jgi:hypothetical protein
VNALRAVSSLGLNNQLASQLTNLQASNAALAFPAAAGSPAPTQTLFFRTQNGSILAPAAGSQAILTGLAGIQGLTGLGALPNGVHNGQTLNAAGNPGSNQQSAHQSQLMNSQSINLNNQRLAYAAAHRQAQALNNLAAVQHHLNQTNLQVAQQQAQALNLQNHLATLAAFSAAQQQQTPQQVSQNQTQQASSASSYLTNPSASTTHSPQSSHVQSSSSHTPTNTSNNLLAASLLQQRPTATGLQIQGGYT